LPADTTPGKSKIAARISTFIVHMYHDFPGEETGSVHYRILGNRPDHPSRPTV
jgi:hypothetical protein